MNKNYVINQNNVFVADDFLFLYVRADAELITG